MPSFLKLLTISVLIVFSSRAEAQTFRYLQVKVLECSNFKLDEINWYESGVDYPDPHLVSQNASLNPNGEQVFGNTPANWSHLRVYDGNLTSHHWIGDITNPLLARPVILDLGIGNSIRPDSFTIFKPGYTTLSKFQVWLSNDNLNWLLFHDTTLTTSGWSSKTFALRHIRDSIDPTIPQDLTATYITSHSLKLFWKPSTDNIRVADYDIYQDGTYIASSKNTNYLVKGLSQNTKYKYKVVAKDFESNSSDFSDEITIFTTEIDTTKPTKPTQLTSTTIESEKVEFSWDKSTDNLAVVGYIIYLDGNSAGTTNNTHFSLPGLTPSTTYTVSVRAKDLAGNISEESDTISVTTTSATNTKMTVGTNYWDVGWGGDPFKSTYALVSEENPWNIDLLHEAGIYGGHRYMDWGRVNSSEITHWSQRTLKADLKQRSVAYEWMIDFCNRTNQDMWICIPHKIIDRNGNEGNDNHYVRKLALLIKTGVDMHSLDLDSADFGNLMDLTRDELIALGGNPTCEPLKPDLKIYLEYSNETWNWQFSQTAHALNEGHALGLDPTYTGDSSTNWVAWQRYHSWAALRVFEKMEDVLGTNTPRLIKIDAYQAPGYAQPTGHHLYVYEDTANIYNPRGIFPDAYSPAPYFGHAVNDTITADSLINLEIDESISYLRRARGLLDNAETRLNRKFKLITYEGGQHLTQYADILNRRPVMYDMYKRYLDSCDLYLDVFFHYAHAGGFSSGGAWGAKENIGDHDSIAHKYRAIKDWVGIDTVPVFDTIVPTRPINLRQESKTKTTATVAWNPATDNKGVASYNLYLYGFLINQISDTTYQFTGLSPSSRYIVTVRAVDSSGNISIQSDSLYIYTTEIYDLTFAVSDIDGPLNDATIVFNSLTVQTDTNGEYSLFNILEIPNLIYTVSKTGYISQTDSFTLDSNHIEDILLERIFVDTISPTQPLVLAQDSNSQTTVNISWDASTDSIGVAHYNIYKDGLFVAKDTNTTYQFTGLTHSSNYWVTISAEDTTGNISATSDSLRIYTIFVDVTPPTQPLAVKQDSNTKTTVNISWNTATDSIGVDHYNIFKDGSFESTSTDTVYQLTGLTHSTNYKVTVTAEDTTGNVSIVSDTLTIYTDKCYELTFEVNDDAGPVENANIVFNATSVFTDANGLYVFDELLPNPKIKYTITKSGYNAYTDSFELDKNHKESILLTKENHSGIAPRSALNGNQLTVYPNPSDSRFTITSGHLLTEVQLYTTAGSLVLQENVNSKEITISIESLKTGIYILKVVLDNGSTNTVQVIKK